MTYGSQRPNIAGTRRLIARVVGVVGAVMCLWAGIRLANHEVLYRRLSDHVVLGGWRSDELYQVTVTGGCGTYPPMDATIASLVWNDRWLFAHTRHARSGTTTGWFVVDLATGALRVIDNGTAFERELDTLGGFTTADLFEPGDVWSWREWNW